MAFDRSILTAKRKCLGCHEEMDTLDIASLSLGEHSFSAPVQGEPLHIQYCRNPFCPSKDSSFQHCFIVTKDEAVYSTEISREVLAQMKGSIWYLRDRHQLATHIHERCCHGEDIEGVENPCTFRREGKDPEECPKHKNKDGEIRIACEDFPAQIAEIETQFASFAPPVEA